VEPEKAGAKPEKAGVIVVKSGLFPVKSRVSRERARQYQGIPGQSREIIGQWHMDAQNFN